MTRYSDERTAWLAAEDQLAREVPFGSVDYIRERGAVIYRRRLALLGEHLPVAVRFALELDAQAHARRIFDDAVVRASIDDLLRTHMSHGREKPAEEQIEFLAYHTTRLDELMRDVLDAEGCVSQGILVRPVRFWSEAGSRTHRDRAFAAVLRQNLPAAPTYLVDEKSRATLERALELLRELLPLAAHSAVSHLQFIVADDFTDEVGSATISRVLGTIFVSHHALRSPWCVAEAILHECMHLKFVELEHTHSVMARGYSEKTSPRIHPPWHPESVTWPVNRALTAAHVYVALALYAVASETAKLEFQGRYGPCQRSPLLVEPGMAAHRARILLELLSAHPGSLGQAGQLFLGWMGDILNKLASEPRGLRKAV